MALERRAHVDGPFWLITVGTLARVIGEPARARSDSPWLRGAVVATGLMQIGGLLAFFATMWARIRPTGSQAREAAGERF